MPDLTITVPDDLMDWLRTAADKNFRSPEGQVLSIISRSRVQSVSHGVRAFRPGMHDLTSALRELWSSAGCPASRTIAGELKVSHSTVHDALMGRRFVSWQRLEVIVQFLGGDAGQFRALWANAATGAADQGTAL